MSDEKLFSQEDIDKIIGERLAREKTKYDALAEKYTALNEEHVSLIGKTKDLEGQLADYPGLKRQTLVDEVAREMQIPSQLVKRLSGETKEEIAADAKRLLEDLGQLDKETYKGLPPSQQSGGEPAKKGFDLILDNLITVG